MVRTVIALATEDKRWIDRKAAAEGVSMSEVVRRAVRRMRTEESRRASYARLLESTAGIRSGEDGLTAQRRLRDEW
jgi:Arc/MetJ-type ribon-helix-helix transcriptional regulator